MKKLVYIYHYFIYRSKAVNEHGVHSPFVFYLLMNVIYNKNNYYCYRAIENVREKLLNSKKTIRIIKNAECKPFGKFENVAPDINTEAEKNNTIEREVAQLAKQHTRSAKFQHLLFRLVNHFQPPDILEIGTSFGISTAYLAIANSKISVVTIEKNREIAEIAKQNFKDLRLKNIEQKIENSNAALPDMLSKYQNLYFVSFDGFCCKQDTLKYFYLCLEKSNASSVFVFFGLYQSAEMIEAWNEIKNNNRVTVTLDLFIMCIVFFRKEQVKQHFVIKF